MSLKASPETHIIEVDDTNYIAVVMDDKKDVLVLFYKPNVYYNSS